MSFCAGFHHAAVQVRDVEQVAAFYRDVLGLPELRRHHHADGALRSIWLSLGGDGDGFLAVEGDPAPGSGPQGWSMIALRIRAEDRPQVEAHLGQRAVPIVRRTGFTLYVRDPEGNLVGLSHYPNAA